MRLLALSAYLLIILQARLCINCRPCGTLMPLNFLSADIIFTINLLFQYLSLVSPLLIKCDPADNNNQQLKSDQGSMNSAIVQPHQNILFVFR